MNIYLVERPDDASWDEYDSFVVIAPTKEQARNIHPGGDDVEWGDSYGNWVSKTDIPSLKVTLLGKAARNYKIREVVCASYNAG